MELSVIWVKDLFALHFKCCYWKMKMRLGSMCLLQVFLLFFFDKYKFFFFTWSKWKENFIRLFYWTWPSVCWSHCTSSRNCAALVGDEIFSFLGNFRNNFPHSFVSHVIFHLSTDTLPQSNPQSLQHCFNLSQTSPF